ncbi:MAG TPA: tetratricopeptide repeat protein [Burkholderiaceae bacterium]|jgi:tetratricopeptide (TPR) repeat protein|nr:tetratricopeptide repeat protein [Burkholderiaceae bacterium]
MSALNLWFYRQMATWAQLLKRDEVALDYWQRIHALQPRDPHPLATIAHMKAGKGRRTEAIALFEQALALDSQQAGTWFNLGFVQQEEARHEQALRSFERAIELDPKLDRAYYGQALSLIKLERLEEAIAPLKKNIELQPMSPYGFYQLAHVYHRLGRAGDVATTIKRLAQFEPNVAKQLERETGVSVGVQVLSP